MGEPEFGKWHPIETAPPGRKMVNVMAPYPTRTGWTDPYACWRDGPAGMDWVRWPHSFPPTVWSPIPSPPSPVTLTEDER